MFKLLKSRKYEIIAASAIILLFCLLLAVYSPVRADQLEVIVEEGQGLIAISQLLKDKDIIRSKGVFVLYTRLIGEDRNLKAGRYVFDGLINVPEVVDILAKGLSQPDDMEVLIPEGSNVWEIDEILADKGIIRVGEFSNKFYFKEGYLFPDTYRFPDPEKEKITIEAIGEKIFDNFKNKTEEEFKGLDAQKRSEIIITASMLEKEAKIEIDMRIVAGIIKKRIELGMLLQLDASVSYGACLRDFKIKNINCDVTLIGVAKELKIDGPYNSYTKKGLPPGPIANPGLKAIRAAMDPQKTDYLFYLSTRDGSQMIFSKTASEHAVNRRKYLGI